MKIIKPSATVMEHNVSPYVFIEKVGRTCYKSEDLISEGSAHKFVQNLIKRDHWAMLEHEHIYLVVSSRFMRDFLDDMRDFNEPLTFFNITDKSGLHILSGSFRSFHDLFVKNYISSPLEHLEYVLGVHFPTVFGDSQSVHTLYSASNVRVLLRCEFLKEFKDNSEVLFKHLIHTFLFVCDRGVSHEFVRHRPCSFAQESTRYCNYAKDKFGNEITVIEPCYLDKKMSAYKNWHNSCDIAEHHYFKMLDSGCTPQEARAVLPTSLKTELIITATESEWQHIVDLRYIGVTGAPHPQMKEVMALAVEDLVEESRGRISYEAN